LARAEQQTQATFRTTSQTVAVYVSVRESSGRLVPDLPKEAFELYDNGKAVDINVFSNDPKPFTMALLLDMSRSMSTQYGRLLDSAKHFVAALRDDDRVRIGSFGREVALSPLLTSDKAVLLRILDEEMWPGGATPLWRAATVAMDSLATESGRRVILALTDGVDSGIDYNCAALVSDPHGNIGPCAGRVDVRRRAVTETFLFYAIGFEGTGLDQGLREIADDTGGGHFGLKKNAALESTFERVADELHHQYLLGFSPGTLDGRVHQLEVRLNRPGLVAKARKSYVAEAGR
jgi:Ca-activated chloride channel family protein